MSAETEHLQDIINIFIHHRGLHDELKASLIKNKMPADIVEAAYREFKRQTGQRRRMAPPPMLVRRDAEEESWYPGASNIAGAESWPALQNYLEQEKKWSADSIKSIDEASDRIVSWLESPYATKIKTRGLVVGYVQSGKTANFMAVIAKAADAGYNFFIVLSGTKNNLRAQTHSRIKRELIGTSTRWFVPPQDGHYTGNINYHMHHAIPNDDNKGKTASILCVVKKNTKVLAKLIDWIRPAKQEYLNQCSFLIIDDEADEASINTARFQSISSPAYVNRTAINAKIVSLLGMLPKAAYVGYTATPFANVLVDPRHEDDLYPRDFIVNLPKPTTHFGTERIFGRERLLDEHGEEFVGFDMIREIPDTELQHLIPQRKQPHFKPKLTNSLKEALIYFWLAVAARSARGQSEQYSTMLIHISQKINLHLSMTLEVTKFRERFIQQLSREYDKVIAFCRYLWEREHRLVPSSDFDLNSVSFDELLPHISTILDDCVEVTDNSTSVNRLDFEGTSKVQIAVGGNTLSRGLTLEGLLVSFFARSAGTYDTLLQMGRWFGYRGGYEDLPRIWMTSELEGHFRDLALIEAEVRQEFDRYSSEFMTPLDYGPRIRTHPDLGVTAPLKMQHAVTVEVSYSRKVQQTVLFNHKDSQWLRKNIHAADNFVMKLQSNRIDAVTHRGHLLFRDVPVNLVQDFLREYQFHRSNQSLSSHLLVNYIEGQQKNHSLRRWNIIVRGVKGERSGNKERAKMRLGGIEVPLLERARRKTLNDHAHIGVLMSKGDVGADVLGENDSLNHLSAGDLLARREATVPGYGLLIIYPIDKDSQPHGKGQSKVGLDASDHLIGLGIVFPEAKGSALGSQEYEYISVDPLKLLSEVDVDDDDELDGDE